MLPHIESLLSLCLSTMQFYNVWLIELAGHYAMIQAHNTMRETWDSWCGGTAGIPPPILESLHEHEMRAQSAMRQCFEKRSEVKEQLAVAQDYVQECLQHERLPPCERILLMNCATALQQCDPDHPSFPLRL
jgi:hypothetical protein